jgi:hypothetical protein
VKVFTLPSTSELTHTSTDMQDGKGPQP